MRMAVIVTTVLAIGSVLAAQARLRSTATMVDPIPAIVEAFRTHNVVALTDPHGNVQMQQFLLMLVRDPRFADVANDVVVEMLSARHQDVIDRFVRGDEVEREVLRQAWEEHTVPSGLGIQAEEFLQTIRSLNASLTPARRLRVLAGDPPIDWDNVITREDHARWIELRDSYPADVIRRRVLDRGRRALVIYGQGHLQRKQIAGNYDMSTWQAQTVVSLLERAGAARVFTVWTLLRIDATLQPEVARWRVPSLALMRGSTLGTIDFATFNRGVLGTDARFAVRDGRLVPLPREAWAPMRMEEQFDAILYLGPPSSMTTATMPASICQDKAFVARRIECLMKFAPPSELESFKTACGL
jgi:hypothetical protein